MNLNKNVRLTFVLLLFIVINIQCANDSPEMQSATCDCKSASALDQMKDSEAVVVFIQGNQGPGGNQGPDLYILSTEPRDFESTSHSAGKNILVPCDSLPAQFRQAGLRLIVSYKRKFCYGAITQPYFRSNYGYYVDLKSIKVKP